MGSKFGTLYEQIAAASADYTVLTGDDAVVITAATVPVTVTLYSPSGKYGNASTQGGKVRTFNAATSLNVVNVVTSSGSIVGNVTLFPGQSAEFVSDGAVTWYNTAASGTSGVLVKALTTAQVLALNTTPITLVPAPGTGKLVIVESVVGKIVFNSIAYTGANAVEIRYTNGSGVKATADLTAAWLNTASGTAFYEAIPASGIGVANAAVVVVVPTANPGAGDSPVTFSVKYRIV